MYTEKRKHKTLCTFNEVQNNHNAKVWSKSSRIDSIMQRNKQNCPIFTQVDAKTNFAKIM
jgi:hypothetical protein